MTAMSPDVTEIGARLHAHVAELYPLCRSITGEGLRATLRYVARRIPLELHEVPSGTRVLDWEVPLEWRVRGATISRMDGEVVVDFARHNLHLVSYSVPVDRVVSRAELEGHLHSLPDQPDLIPYLTSYYQRNWGFCLTHRARLALQDEAYHVRIDAELAPGSLSYGECVLPGEEPGEVLFSSHSCHPSLANDNVSAVAVAIELARALAARPRRRFTYRFLFAPGTLGAICWLAANRDAPARVRHGLVLTCLGGPAAPSYKQSRRGDAPIDRYAGYVLRSRNIGHRILPFTPTGYDERQFCSPGFDLPMGSFARTRGGTFPEYHTSADHPDFVQPAELADSLDALLEVVELIEHDSVWRNTAPFGEPQLGRYGLYGPGDREALLWVLNLSDGRHSLFEIAERSGRPFAAVLGAATALRQAGLLVPAETATLRACASAA
jgi:aminopeptidase-like protein